MKLLIKYKIFAFKHKESASFSMEKFVSQTRVVKNTCFLYFRHFIILLVTLYTSRVVLKVLGNEDYGIYSIVYGSVMMLNIVTGALTHSISRFMMCELGRNADINTMKRTFTVSVLIELLLSFICLVLVLTLGMWFVQHKLVIPSSRIEAARWVLIISCFHFVIDLLDIPFRSMIITHEKMNFYAYSGILDAGLRLGVCFLLQFSQFDSLIYYSILLLLTTIVLRSIDAFYCIFSFKECRLSFKIEKKIFWEILKFAGWAFLGNGSFIIKDQGSNIMLNLFCGPLVNAAMGIALQVRSAINHFVTNFLTAIRPQVIKSYSAGQLDDMRELIQNGARLSYYLLLVLSLPIIFNIRYILDLWLVNPPDHAATFVTLLLIFSLIDSLAQTTVMGLLAEGNIRNYEIALLILNASIIPISYICLTFDLPPECVLVSSVIIGILVNLMRMKFAVKAFGLKLKPFCKKVIFPAGLVTAMAIGISLLFAPINKNTFWSASLYACMIGFTTALLILFFGMKANERQLLFKRIKLKLTRT